jgi:tripartite-type tricarboxylate transporter receptor subunit TctC
LSRSRIFRNNVYDKKKAANALNRRSIIVGMAATLFISRGARADEFPSRPIRLIVFIRAGSTANIVARKVGGKAGDILKQTLIENRPCGGGTIGAEESWTE